MILREKMELVLSILENWCEALVIWHVQMNAVVMHRVTLIVQFLLVRQNRGNK